MLQLEFHIQAWLAFLKEPLRCGFKRNSLCGSRAGREPSMEETLQCVSARGANDLACCLKLGVGKRNGMFQFYFFIFFLGVCFSWGRILVTACWCLWACQVSPTSCHGCWAGVCVSVWMRVCLYACLCGICTIYPCNFAFFSISPSVPSQRCFCTPLNYATSAEWSGKKGKAGIL